MNSIWFNLIYFLRMISICFFFKISICFFLMISIWFFKMIFTRLWFFFNVFFFNDFNMVFALHTPLQSSIPAVPAWVILRKSKIRLKSWNIGALQASHLQCQPEAIAAWQQYVEHWLQLRVVKTTTKQRDRKESPTQWPWLMKPPRHNVPIFWFFISELPSYQGARRRPPR